MATAYTGCNLFFVKQGYFVPLMRSRVMPVLGYTAALNVVVLFILLKPLRPEEIRAQLNKRQVMGKWLTSLYHLEDVYGDNVKPEEGQ